MRFGLEVGIMAVQPIDTAVGFEVRVILTTVTIAVASVAGLALLQVAMTAAVLALAFVLVDRRRA